MGLSAYMIEVKTSKGDNEMETLIYAAILLQYGCIAASFTFQKSPLHSTGLSRALDSGKFIGFTFTITSVLAGVISTILLIMELEFLWGVGAFLLIGLVGGVVGKLLDKSAFDLLSLSSILSLIAGFTILIIVYIT